MQFLVNIKDLKNAEFAQNQAKSIVDTFFTISKNKDDIIKNLVEVGSKETQAEAIANLVLENIEIENNK